MSLLSNFPHPARSWIDSSTVLHGMNWEFVLRIWHMWMPQSEYWYPAAKVNLKSGVRYIATE